MQGTREQGTGRQQGYLAAASTAAHSSLPISSAAAATFSSRCATFDVPGIGSITGERCSSHTSESCETVAECRAANSASASAAGCSGFSSFPPAIGYHGKNAIPRRSQ